MSSPSCSPSAKSSSRSPCTKRSYFSFGFPKRLDKTLLMTTEWHTLDAETDPFLCSGQKTKRIEDFCNHLKGLEHIKGLFEGLNCQHLTAIMDKLISWQRETPCPQAHETELKAIHVLMQAINERIDKEVETRQHAATKKRLIKDMKAEDDEIILAASTGETKPKRRSPSKPVEGPSQFMGSQ